MAIMRLREEKERRDLTYYNGTQSHFFIATYKQQQKRAFFPAIATPVLST
jgi:hypothetical protein